VKTREGFAEVGGTRLWYEVAGDGPPVVLIHSGLSDARQWDEQIAVFAQRYTVLRYDQRGYGRSDPPSGPYSPPSDGSLLLDAVGIREAALVGVSQGAGIALAVAVDHPELVSALVLTAPGAVGFERWSEEMETTFEAKDEAVSASDVDRVVQMALDTWVPAGRFRETDGLVRRVALENKDAWKVPDAWERWPEVSRLDRLGEIRVPTLVVAAENDVPDIQTIGNLLWEGIAGAKKVTIPGTDHLVNVRNPEAFNEVVLSFLREALG
jgi:3-oxoadipate enol-lactonase